MMPKANASGPRLREIDSARACAQNLRMSIRVKPTPAKKAVNLSIDSELLKAAREDGLNLSKVLERALKEERARRWLAENKDAIEAYNEDIRKHGVWSDGLRSW